MTAVACAARGPTDGDDDLFLPACCTILGLSRGPEADDPCDSATRDPPTMAIAEASFVEWHRWLLLGSAFKPNAAAWASFSIATDPEAGDPRPVTHYGFLASCCWFMAGSRLVHGRLAAGVLGITSDSWHTSASLLTPDGLCFAVGSMFLVAGSKLLQFL